METLKIPKRPIVLACEVVGSQAEMSRILSVSTAFMNQMWKGTRPIPAEYCKSISKATNGLVSCQDLRPNDWQKFWPELADTEMSTNSALLSRKVKRGYMRAIK